ncbi:hypothetical protein RHSIM_Rhsim04G0159300 [Rhododendron simsii]|uniref:DNA helicase Pif1-like 2B domain-containing protein n=1 Tax=Rhododendron simsii TaxID=118357 RepID=A0A834H2T1_RHOSS|nr:hypothetical protein RHSIM_Rhsim04G0159300 [Rhododendron simsii]
MEKMKEVEKEETEAFGEGLKGNGVGKKAWPFSWRVSLVRARRPEGVNSVMPSRVRFREAALKLLKVKLRNIAPNDGLCNGTRMMVVKCGSRIIEVKILTGDKFGKLAFIPRISLSPSSSDFPFHLTRRQFPVRLAYVMTINKSQGQSVKFVGVDLCTTVFSHGQLYVALSRCTSFDRITVILPEEETDSTTNIVYHEILL